MIDREHLGALVDALGAAALRPVVAEGCVSLSMCESQLSEAAMSGDYAELRALAHRLRGRAAMLGCRALAAELSSLENLASASHSSAMAIRAQIEAIAPIAHATVAALQTFGGQRPSSQPAANAATIATHQIQLDDPVAAGCGAEAAGAAGAVGAAPAEAGSGCGSLAVSLGATAGA